MILASQPEKAFYQRTSSSKFRGQTSLITKMACEQIIPVHEFDSMAVYPNIVLSLMLKYDKILDPIILRGSMIELVNREGWCKLGSRLKRNVNTTPSPSSSILSSFLLPAGLYQLVQPEQFR